MDFSKLLMYEFHYKYIGRKFNNNDKLLFTDKDSLVYGIETNYVYEDFYGNENLFDFSNYPEDSNIFDPVDKNVIGKMKDEVKRKIISEFVELKLKMYLLVIVGSEEIKKAKVVNKNIVENTRQRICSCFV